MKLVVNAYMSILIEGVAEALELAGFAIAMMPLTVAPATCQPWPQLRSHPGGGAPAVPRRVMGGQFMFP
jgi:hypothetical protein